MSSKRVRYFRKDIGISSTTFGGDIITVNTVKAHNLITGDVVSILMKNSTTQVDVSVTVTAATAFTFASTYDLGIQSDGIVIVPFFRFGDGTGAVASMSLSNSSALQPLLSSFFSNTTATVTYQLQGSIDNKNWFNIGTAISHTTGAAQGTAITVNAPYLQINITAAITGTEKLTIGVSS